jgi:hypothetical protein
MALANITNNILTDSGILVGSLLTTSSAASTYVPYTGATADLVLGNRLSKANSFYADGDGSFTSGGLFLKQYASGATNITGYNIITTQTSGFLFSASVASSFKNFILDVSSLTDVTQRTYTLPDASGTLALTSSLSGMVTGTGTNNYIPKFTTTGSTIGNSIISESGSVITVAGTIVASNRITINGNNDLAFYGASSSTGYMHLQLSNTGNTTRLAQEGSTGGNMAVGSSAYATILNSTGAYSLQLATNNTVRATLDASGNLGLGVTPSAWSGVTTLQIGNSSLGDASTNLQLTHNAYYDGGNWRYITSAAASNYYQAGGFHFWRTAPSGTAGNAISFTQAMTLNASGNLSLGNTNDTYKLDVTGTGRFTDSFELNTTGTGALGFFGANNTTDKYFRIRNSSGNFEMGTSSTEHYLIGNGAIPLKFFTSGTTRLTIASTGAATFSSSVTVGTDIFLNYDYAIRFKNSGGTYRQILAYADDTYLDARDGGIIFRTGTGGTATERMLITSGGDLYVKGNGSDITLSTRIYSDDTYSDFLASATSATAKTMRFFAKNTLETMRITSGGSVLIGTTTEGFLGKLQVAGSVAITGQYNTVLPSSSFSYFDGSGQVVSSSSNASALYLDTTWNTTGNPDGIYLNVTNTASGASSKLLNLKVGSVSQFSVSKGGAIQTSDPTNGTARPWKLGDARSGTISTDSYIIVEVNGVTYSIPALNGLP